jgi:hypothetical protein
MKMNRDELKAIIKECLVEILSEGLGNVSTIAESRHSHKKSTISGTVQASRSTQRRFDPRLDTPAVNKQRSAPTPIVGSIKSAAAGNSILESIMADTAATTLQTMVENGDSSVYGDSKNAGMGMTEQVRGNPEDFFCDETVSKWSKYAFDEPLSPEHRNK